ncbi:ABC transporter substrate-binding protein [Vibrio sp. S4M6]|uniref:peptide ABC transporter substrate-binding protein n=1 Tax=Vibrio sinus TaxID=2946865 RepID=UPI00202A2FFF|nr:ABC transporter substrate-binding protein [Vibrio sinus]MCL9782272.1 ABC transporter substrate-binding protein [Vibrio sinus]
MYKKKLSTALIVGAGLALTAASTTSYAANVPAGTKLAKVQDLVRGNRAEPATLDPDLIEGIPGANVAYDLFEGLVTQDANGNTIPGVAKSWQTKDNKTYIFHLRKDAKWSSGAPVTAQDFVFSFERAVNPDTASPYAWYLEESNIKNASAIIAGKKKPDTLGVKALNDHTLQITLESPIPYFVKMLVNSVMSPVYPPAIKKWGDKWTQPGHMVSNGAYELEKRVVGGRIVLKRNPYYWDNKHTVINQVTYLPDTDQTSSMNRYLAGEEQMTYAMPIDQYRRLKKEYPNAVKTTGELATYYYSFNMTKKPFNNVDVRKAISYAIDRNIIADAILGQGQLPAYTLTPDIVAGFTPITPTWETWTQKERVAKAKKLLKEAGYDREHPLSFDLLYNTDANNKKIATAVQAMLKQELGVNVTLVNQEWKTYLQTLHQGDFEVARESWSGDYNEPSTFLNLMTTSNAENDPKYHNKEYDALIRKAMTLTNDKERNELYHKAERMLARDMPVAPIYQFVTSRLVSPTIGGYPMHNAQDIVYTKNLYIKKS